VLQKLCDLKSWKFWLAFHVLLGLSTYFTHWILVGWLYLFILFTLYEILRNRIDNYLILAVSLAYVLGIELLCRIAETTPYIPYEFAKYYFLLTLTVYIIIVPLKGVSPGFFIVALSLPSLLLIPRDEFRVYFVNSFSGIFLTGLIGYVFYKVRIDKANLNRIIMIMLYGLIAITVAVIIRTPDLEEVDFSLAANFETSGNFGSNQVSTVMGMATMLIGLVLLVNLNVFQYKSLQLSLFFLFAVRGLLTFSRGGILAGVLSLFFSYIVPSGKYKGRLKFSFATFLLVVCSIGIAFYFVNRITDEALLDRFKGETDATKRGLRESTLETLTSRRSTLMWAEWQIFLKNPILGVGPGAGYEARKEIVGFRIASHTEVTRLLAEHGLFGLVIAIIFLIFPLRKILRSPVGFDRIISTAFFSFAILTSFHAAMRTTVTPFLWGLACANFSEFSEKKRLRRSNSEFS
jgi:hypothetical protein